jgi:hypothetical protein
MNLSDLLFDSDGIFQAIGAEDEFILLWVKLESVFQPQTKKRKCVIMGIHCPKDQLLGSIMLLIHIL